MNTSKPNLGDLVLYSYWDFKGDGMKYFLGIIKKIKIDANSTITYFVDWVEDNAGNREEYFIWEIEKFKENLWYYLLNVPI